MTELDTQLKVAYQRLAAQYEQQSKEIIEQVAALGEQVILLTNSKSSISKSVKNKELNLSNELMNSACSDCDNALWTKKNNAESHAFECLIAAKVQYPVDFCSKKQ